jgi:hypothetical protein
MRLVAWDLLHWEISHIKGRVISSCLLASCAWNLIIEMIVLLFSHVEKTSSEKFIDYGRPWICVKWEVIFLVKLDLWGWPCISLLTCGFICLYCCCLFFYLVCKFFSPALILVDLSTWFYAFSLGWELKKAIWIAVHMTFLWCFNMWVSEVQHVWLLFFIWRMKWQLLLVR